MLYKLSKSAQIFDAIDPLPFSGLPLEKELEDLLAQNLWDVLFEGSQLMPIFQERSWQPEADIYALNEHGDLVIFELKRAHADGGAVHQALRYCEKAGRFSYEKLEGMLQKYRKGNPVNLQQEHQIGFDLEHPLDRSAFNKQQLLIIVGSAGDAELIRNVDSCPAPNPTDRLDFFCERHVLGRHFVAGVVRVEADGDAMVDVAPVGVVVHRLGLETNPHHEGHRFLETAKLKRSHEGVALEAPAGQFAQRGGDLGGSQGLACHMKSVPRASALSNREPRRSITNLHDSPPAACPTPAARRHHHGWKWTLGESARAAAARGAPARRGNRAHGGRCRPRTRHPLPDALRFFG